MFEKIKVWFMGFFGILWDYIKVLFNSTVKKEIELVLPIASKIVAMVAADPAVITNEEKRNAAFMLIKEELLRQQKNVGTSIINLAIEMAVQKLKLGA